MTSQQPAGYRLAFPATAAEVAQEAERLQAKSTEFHDQLASMAVEEVKVSNFVQRMCDFEGEYCVKRSAFDLIQNAFTEREMRDASAEADKKLSAHEVELETRKDLFDRFKAVQERLRSGQDSATPEVVRYVERNVLEGVRNGLNLPEQQRLRIKEIKTEMSRLAIDFSKNLSEDVSFELFSREELAGLPEDLIASLEVDEASGKLKLTTKYPHYFPAMKLATNPETRRRMELKFNSRCKDTNLPLLQQLVRLRREKATILGYSTHADFVLEMRMAKDAKTVQDFMSRLSEKLKPLQEQERKKLLQLKEQDCQRLGLQFDNALNPWDLRYLMNKVEELEYAVDHEKLREYFPLETVTKGLLEIYQRILGLKFSPVPDCWVWHPDVRVYAADDAGDGKRLGYFVLDLYPREGKYGHACAMGLQPSCLIAGQRQLTVCVVLANFSKPTAGKPSLLTHDEVETFFHEFGHAMHGVCSLAETAKFAGTNVERDFVEAPSQMLENWVWARQSLALMSGHYATGEPIPEQLLRALIRSRQANTAFFNQRQLGLAAFDQAIHTSADPDLDVVAEYSRAMGKFLGVTPSEGSAMPATFNHMAGGYDAQYYGYMWSEVFSADMFAERFGEDRLLDPRAGDAYRRCVLQPGGGRDAVDMLREFLGREPNEEAFLRQKGL